MDDTPGPASGKASGVSTVPVDPTRKPLPRPSPLPLAFLLFLAFAIVAALVTCSPQSGLPREPGQYQVRPGSLQYEEGAYRFLWSDRDGQFHEAQSRDVKLQRDDRTFLEISPSGPAVLHLRNEEQVQVRRSDRAGGIPWIPFPIGGGPVIIGPSDGPTYRAPPPTSDGGTIRGSESSDRPVSADNRRTSGNPVAIGGQDAGTGKGTAATGKPKSSSSGQLGGSGSGGAATNKARPQVGGGSSTGPKVGGGRVGAKR